MPQPYLTQVHVDAPLTMMSVAYIQDHNNFVAARAFPIIPVEKQSDIYFTYDKDDWFRDEAAPRGLSQESAGGGYNIDHSGQYLCVPFGFHKDIDDRVRANADSPLSPDREATEFVTQRMLLRQERAWVANNFVTGKWSVDKTPTALWSDYAASNPIEDIEDGKESILSTTGFEANTLVLAYPVVRKLRNHPDFVDRIKYTGGILDQIQTEKNLAALFGLKQVLVAKAVVNSAAEGATAVYGFTHGKNALLCHVADSPGIMTPSAGYTFMWKGVSQNLGANVAIKRFRMEWLNSDRVEGNMAFDHKLIARDLGYFFSNVVA